MDHAEFKFEIKLNILLKLICYKCFPCNSEKNHAPKIVLTKYKASKSKIKENANGSESRDSKGKNLFNGPKGT